MYNSSLAQVVRGKVIDTSTEESVKDALIFLMPKKDRIWDMQISDSLGFFFFNKVLHKSFYIKTDRLGYVDFTFGKLVMPQNDTLSITINLEPVPFVMKEVPVIAKKPDYDRELDLIGFYRRKKFGWGKFITRDDFKYRHVSRTVDLIRGIPGVMIFGDKAYSNAGFTRGSIPMSVYLDGTIMDDDGVISPLDIVSPNSIKAIEVYSNGMYAPYQYSRGRYGGVILIWT